MPRLVTTHQFTRLARTVRHLRDERDAHLDITPDTIRLRALAYDRSVFLDYTIPCTPLGNDATEDAAVWLNADSLATFLTAADTDTITLHTPAETRDSRVVLHAGRLTARISPLDSAYPLLFTDPQPTPVHTTTTLPHHDVQRSLTAADLVGKTLDVHITPDTNTVEFNTATKPRIDTFTYTIPTANVTATGRDTTITVGTRLITDLLSSLPGDHSGTLSVTPSYLHYETSPHDNESLRVFIAEHTKALR